MRRPEPRAGTVVRTRDDNFPGWTFVHGPGIGDPILGQRDKGNGSFVDLYWITDGRDRQYGVGDGDGVDCVTRND